MTELVNDSSLLRMERPTPTGIPNPHTDTRHEAGFPVDTPISTGCGIYIYLV